MKSVFAKLTGIFSTLLWLTVFILQPEPVTAKQDHPGCLDILIDTQACQCIRDRNQEMQETINRYIKSAVLDTSIIKVHCYDYAKQDEIVDSLLQATHERFLPVLILKSCENIVFYECSFMIDTTNFLKSLSDFNTIYLPKE